MNVEELRDYCLNKPCVTESFPFDQITLVFKVYNKLFALTTLNGTTRVNLKCNPEKAIELREQFSAIIPGFHMNKKHWNTVDYSQLDSKLTKELIDHSFDLVIKSLPKKVRHELAIEFPELKYLE